MASTVTAALLALVVLAVMAGTQADPVLDWLKSKSHERTSVLSSLGKRLHEESAGHLEDLNWHDYLNDFVNGYWLHVPKGVLKKSNGWRSHVVPIQTRFAPFGTKILPSSDSAESSGTLLRYGRSA